MKVFLEALLHELPEGPSYAVEVRHKSWLDSELPDRERGAALTLDEFPSGHTRPKKDRTEDLRWWSGLMDRFIGDGKTVFAYANNHYQNHSPSTVEEFLEIRWEERS